MRVSSVAGAAGDGRGIFYGGLNPDAVNTIGYVTIANTGNASDFGDTPYISRSNQCAGGNSVRGIAAGGGTPSPGVNSMCYFTFATTGNAADFGDLTLAASHHEGSSNGHGGVS